MWSSLIYFIVKMNKIVIYLNVFIVLCLIANTNCKFNMLLGTRKLFNRLFLFFSNLYGKGHFYGCQLGLMKFPDKFFIISWHHWNFIRKISFFPDIYIFHHFCDENFLILMTKIPENQGISLTSGSPNQVYKTSLF